MTTYSPQHPMPGVVYPPAEQLKRYFEAGALTRETLVDGLKASAARHAAKPAVVGRGLQITYAELDVLTDRLGGALLRLGLQPLDRVVFQIANSPELLLLFVACLKAGLIPVCTLAAHREHEIGYLGALSEARLHVVQGDDPKFDDVDFAQRMRERIPTMRWTLQARGAVRGNALGLQQLLGGTDLASAQALLHSVPRDPLQVAVFQLSGGTTGVPKIIPRMHSEYLYNMRSVAAFNGYTPQDVLFMPLPMMHNLNMGCCFGPFLMTGGTIVLANTMDADELVETLREHPPTWAAMGAVLARIQPQLDSGVLTLPRLKAAIAPNGAPRLREVLGAPVRHIFGMTEGVIMMTRDDQPQEVQDTMVGRPVSAFDQVKLLVPGTEQEITQDDVEGESAFAGPYTLHGYYRAEERNREAFTSDGFYRSGDLMRFRTIDGVRYYQFRGRLKDIVSRGGEKINCEEVEVLIRTHPAVTNVQIVAMPDAALGERACAFIQPKPGHVAPGVAELGRFLESEGLAKFKWPERVEPVVEFPTTKTGKLSKVLLKEIVVERLAAEAAAKQGRTS